MAARTFAKLFDLDARSLALFRIGLGLLLLADLAMRVPTAEVMLTDQGVLPWSLLEGAPLLSLYSLSGSPAWTWVLFALSAASALVLTVGLRSRAAAIVSWVLLVSLQNRNPFVYHAGDNLLRLAAFWAMFLPLGEAFSLDARRLPPGRPATVRTGGTVGLYLLLGSVFLFLFDHKLLGQDWLSGEATQYALSIGFFSRPLGEVATQFPAFTRIATYLTLALQAVVVLLMASPWRQPLCRVLAFAAVTMQQLGFGTMMWLGLFPFVSVVAYLPLLPSEVWNRFLPATSAPLKPELSTAEPRPVTWLAAVAIVLSLAWNLKEAGIGLAVPDAVGDAFERVVLGVRLDQRWAMFSPNVQREDGWFLFRGRTAAGAPVDMFARLTREPERPAPRVPLKTPTRFQNHRWLMLMLELLAGQNATLGRGLVEWSCRSWNAGSYPEGRVTQVELLFDGFDHLPNGQASPTTVRTLAAGRCP